MTLSEVFKYPGENKMSLTFKLSLQYRLTLAAFSMIVNGVSANDYIWTVSQQESNLSQVAF